MVLMIVSLFYGMRYSIPFSFETQRDAGDTEPSRLTRVSTRLDCHRAHLSFSCIASRVASFLPCASTRFFTIVQIYSWIAPRDWRAICTTLLRQKCSADTSDLFIGCSYQIIKKKTIGKSNSFLYSLRYVVSVFFKSMQCFYCFYRKTYTYLCNYYLIFSFIF